MQREGDTIWTASYNQPLNCCMPTKTHVANFSGRQSARHGEDAEKTLAEHSYMI